MYSSIVKKFPRRGEEVFHSKLFQNILGDIDKWIASWSSFLQQMVSLLQNKQHEKHLANRNIQATRRELSNMQDAYDSIVKHTFPYFDVQAVKEEEKIWYYRLSKTIAFYFSNPNSIGYTVHAKDVVVHWWDQQEKNRIEKIRELGNRLGIFLDAEFIIPTHIIEKGDLLQASIGIRGLRWEELEQEQAKIFVGFSDLVDTDLDYFILIPIIENHTENNLGLQIPIDFLIRVKESLATEQPLKESEFFNPMAIFLEKEMLDSLPGIFLKEVEGNIVKSSIGEILVYLWRLSEIRNRLSIEEKTENAWRQELEKDCEQHLTESLMILRREATMEIWSKYQKLTETIIQNKESFTSEPFHQLFVEDLQ